MVRAVLRRTPVEIKALRGQTVLRFRKRRWVVAVLLILMTLIVVLTETAAVEQEGRVIHHPHLDFLARARRGKDLRGVDPLTVSPTTQAAAVVVRGRLAHPQQIPPTQMVGQD